VVKAPCLVPRIEEVSVPAAVDVPAAPALKVRALYKDVRRRALRRLGRDPDATPGDLDYRPIPRVLWLYWHQGWTEAPELVCRCRATWERRNPGWTIRILDRHSASEHSSLEPPAAMGIAHRTDLLRLDLLDRHGGVWADATCACQTPLDAWLPAVAYRGFFAFSRPFADRALSNWFLAGAPGHPLARRWRDAILAYWSGGRTDPGSYTIHHELFEALLRSDPAFRAAWALVPSLSAVPAHLAQHFLRGRVDEAAVAALVASGGAPVHKLSRKLPPDAARLDRVFALIEAAASAGS
jgi:hypothetical protein